MGCCGDREKGITVAEDQKWDYINLSDFKSTSCLAPFSYAWLWVLVFVSCAVYVADAFTAVNLLAFDRWTSEVKPKVPFEIAKWIFAITIIISYVFLAYRWIRALRVMRSNSVTECYLEPLAAIWQSMRITPSGQGWRRFLVFAELTKSKKGANYIALFVYFQFKSALLIVVAQGPRIAINAMTLYAVMQANLLPIGDHASKDRSGFEQFFVNIKLMVDTGNKRETIIYFTMLFSLIIWVIAALALFASVILYLLFLWHYIPRADGSLTNYCRRKVETRLERIVGKKIKKAIEKQDQKRREEERKAVKKGNLDPSKTKPTLPKLEGDDDMSVFSMQRSDTMSTVSTMPNGPARTNTMGTNSSRAPTLPTVGERPGMPMRSDTHGTNYTNQSYSSNQGLLSDASGMGYSTPTDPMPPMNRDYFGGGNRPFTPSNRPFSPMSQGGGNRPFSPMSQPGGNRPFSPMSQGGRSTPMSNRGPLPPVDTSYANPRYNPPPMTSDLRSPSPAQTTQSYPEFSPFDSRGPGIGHAQAYELSPVDADADYTPRSYTPSHAPSSPNTNADFAPPALPSALRVGSPAMSQLSSPPSAIPPRIGTAPPMRAGTAPPPQTRQGMPQSLLSGGPVQRRDMSSPLAGGMRSATAPISEGAGFGAPPPRSLTPGGAAVPERTYTPVSGSVAGRSYTPGPGPGQ